MTEELKWDQESKLSNDYNFSAKKTTESYVGMKVTASLTNPLSFPSIKFTSFGPLLPPEWPAIQLSELLCLRGFDKYHFYEISNRFFHFLFRRKLHLLMGTLFCMRDFAQLVVASKFIKSCIE